MKQAYIVKIGTSAADVHDVFVVIANSADGACVKIKKEVDFSEYGEGSVIQCAEAVSGTVIE